MKNWREYRKREQYERRIYVLRALKESARQKKKKTRTDRYFITEYNQMTDDNCGGKRWK